MTVRKKSFTMNDILTPAELARCSELYLTCAPGTFAGTIKKEIIEPNIGRISTALNTPMDAGYVAYSVEYALMMLTKKKGK